MKTNVPVSTIMTKNVVQLNLSDSLGKAEQLFKKHHIRHLPVVNCGKVVGIFSYTDLQQISITEITDDEQLTSIVYDRFTLEQVMTKDVITIPSFTPIREAAALFIKNDFRAVPVVYENKLAGILTTTDIIRYLLSCYEKEKASF